MNGACNSTFFWPRPPPLPWGGIKRSNVIKFHSKILYQTLCVFSQTWQIIDITHIERDFYSVAWGGQIFFYSEHGHVAYQIEMTMSRTGYMYNFHLYVERCPKLGHSPYLVAFIFESVGIYDGAPSTARPSVAKDFLMEKETLLTL